MDYSVFNTLLDGVFIVNVEKEVIYCNDAAANFCGYNQQRIKPGSPLSQWFQTQPDILAGDMGEIVSPTPYREISFQNREGNMNYVQVTVQPYAQENVQHWILYVRDVSLERILQTKYKAEAGEKKQALQKLELAKYDFLTQVYNKGFFVDKFHSLFKVAKKKDFQFCLILFDIDNFKVLNDTYGHQAGDKVLKEIGFLIKDNLIRTNDVIARFGGEEFVILLERCELKIAARIAQRICEGIANYEFTYQGKRMPVTVSLGVGENKSSHASPEAFFEEVDQATYTSKRNGKNQVTIAE